MEDSSESTTNSPSRPSTFVEKQSFVWDRNRNKAISSKNRRRKLVKFEHATSVIEGEQEAEEKDPESVQKIADDYFLAGDLNQAAKYYALALEEQTKFDSNNNDKSMDTQSTNLEWSESYLHSKMSEIEKKIDVLPSDADSYLEKAALLFLQDRWSDARNVLAVAMTTCSEKSQIRATIGNLNKLERSLAMAMG